MTWIKVGSFKTSRHNLPLRNYMAFMSNEGSISDVVLLGYADGQAEIKFKVRHANFPTLLTLAQNHGIHVSRVSQFEKNISLKTAELSHLKWFLELFAIADPNLSHITSEICSALRMHGIDAQVPPPYRRPINQPLEPNLSVFDFDDYDDDMEILLHQAPPRRVLQPPVSENQRLIDVMEAAFGITIDIDDEFLCHLTNLVMTRPVRLTTLGRRNTARFDYDQLIFAIQNNPQGELCPYTRQLVTADMIVPADSEGRLERRISRFVRNELHKDRSAPAVPEEPAAAPVVFAHRRVRREERELQEEAQRFLARRGPG